MAGVYTELGYELVALPLVPVETRLRFVLAEAGLK
jgi:predicted ATPase